MPDQHSIDFRSGEKARKTRQLIFVLILGVLLMLQGLYSFATRPEPYPTIRMPSFGDSPTPSGKFANDGIEISVVLVDGAVLHPSPDELAADVRYSSARETLDHAFRPKGSGERNPRADDPEVVSWLASRVTELSPTPAQEVRFCWRKRVVDISDAAVERIGPCETEVVDI